MSEPAVDECRVCGAACVACAEKRAAAKLQAELEALKPEARLPTEQEKKLFTVHCGPVHVRRGGEKLTVEVP